MFDRHESSDQAVIVHIGVGGKARETDTEEFAELVRSAGAEVRGTVGGTRAQPDPRLFVGGGKAREIRDLVKATGSGVVVFNHSLSPSQERNLEKELCCRVLDRSGLILDIFSQRARSFEGKLQVELAQLTHLSTRLVRGWTHLERQKGGIGLRGPGETQLETDRRLIGQRIKALRKRLAKVSQQREQGRRNRAKAEQPVVSLVGYTNAGKSTLFNKLTGAGVYAADQLFATLDPTLRKLPLGRGGRTAIIADTVGFVRDLPHELVAAFRSTLQETRDATLLLHVIDASDPERLTHTAQVDEVLDQIGASRVPQILVYNKTDILGEPMRVWQNADGVMCIRLSARTEEGLDALRDLIADAVARERLVGRLALEPSEGGLRAALYELGAVYAETDSEDGGWLVDLDLAERDAAALEKRFSVAIHTRLAEACAPAPGSQSDPSTLAPPASTH